MAETQHPAREAAPSSKGQESRRGDKHYYWLPSSQPSTTGPPLPWSYSVAVQEFGAGRYPDARPLRQGPSPTISEVPPSRRPELTRRTWRSCPTAGRNPSARASRRTATTRSPRADRGALLRRFRGGYGLGARYPVRIRSDVLLVQAAGLVGDGHFEEGAVTDIGPHTCHARSSRGKPFERATPASPRSPCGSSRSGS